MPVENNPFAAKIVEMENTAPLAAPRQYPTRKPAAEAKVFMATERQCRYILDLMDGRKWAEHKWAARIAEVGAQVKRHIDLTDAEIIGDAPITADAASKLIDTLKNECRFIDRPAKTVGDMPDVPAGKYALTIEGATGDDNDIAFYDVDRPTEGRWAGYTFVTMILGGGGEQKVSRAASRTILGRIAADPAGAARLFGQKTETCGVCGRNLTNKVSRDYGIGPDCRQKTGW
jgi:hypothetical protein